MDRTPAVLCPFSRKPSLTTTRIVLTVTCAVEPHVLCTGKATNGSWTAEEDRATSQGHVRPSLLSPPSRGWLAWVPWFQDPLSPLLPRCRQRKSLSPGHELLELNWKRESEEILRSELATWPILVRSFLLYDVKILFCPSLQVIKVYYALI